MDKIPYDDEIERIVLGTLLIDPSNTKLYIGKIKPEYFYNPRHKLIFDGIKEMEEEGRLPDAMTLSRFLASKKFMSQESEITYLDKVGGSSYIMNIVSDTVYAHSLDEYINILANLAMLRELITASAEIKREAISNPENPIEVIDRAEEKILKIRTLKDTAKALGMSDVAREALRIITERHEVKGDIIGVPTGFYTLDRRLSGLKPGEMIILAARPSVGKTATALNITFNAANNGYPVLFFSLEMPATMLYNRLISSYTSISFSKIVNPSSLNEPDFRLLFSASDQIEKKPIFFVDNTTDIMEIKSLARRKHQELVSMSPEGKGLGLIVIDYIGLISTTKRFESHQYKIAYYSMLIKQLARELQVPILVLSQLNRGVEKDKDIEPKLSHLRDSGALEQDADVVLFLYEPTKKKKEESEIEMEDFNMPAERILKIAKNRNGPVGIVKLVFKRDIQKMMEMGRVQ